MNVFIRLIAVAFITGSLTAEVLTFGIVPQQSAQQLAQNWQPLLSELERVSGLTISFRTAPTIPEFERRLAEGEYDIAYMNPYHYTVFSEAPGYQSLVKAKDKRIRGIVVVHKDSTYQTLADLEGLILAFPAPHAFAATVLPSSHFKQQGVTIERKFVRTHDSVYLTIQGGLYEAGGGVMRTFNNMSETVKQDLKILWSTPGYTPHAIAVHPRLTKEQVRLLLNTLLELVNSEEGMVALNKLSIKGFEQANNDEWDDVRALNISPIEAKN